MNKLEQIELLKQSIKTGIRNEVETMIQNIGLNQVFENHILEDYDNGVYNKLSYTEVSDLLSEVTNQLELKVEKKFNSNDTSLLLQW